MPTLSSFESKHHRPSITSLSADHIPNHSDILQEKVSLDQGERPASLAKLKKNKKTTKALDSKPFD